MTIAALRRLLDQAQPDVVRPPAPKLPPRRIHPRNKENSQVNAYNAVILSMNNDGYSDQKIADHLGIDRTEVTEIIDAAKAEQTGQPQHTGPAQTAPASEATPAVAELLAWAAAHEDQAVRDHGTQAAAALTALRERRAVDAELAQITTEAAQLEKRLAALRAREGELRPTPAAKRRPRDYDPGEVRAWGRKNGYTVPDRGQIPKNVLNAWRARHSHQLQAVS
ncbi:histone-like nucleoid-structuring protein Lsr2 [Streptomyces sp. NPDC048330]|uniref:Lsr2 family DNA-binding protein n=1 Tax=Streptomyces sp. NPDC048330 TaxID=3365533 RepID=UPI003714E020